MSSIPPPATGDRVPPKIEPKVRRPKYLVVALVMALAFGAGCWTEGCGRLAFYRGETDYGAELNREVKDDQDRARVEGLYQKYLDAADAGRGKVIPLAAAIFVLGAALLALGARGLAGKSNTRSALVQVVAVQAVVVAAYFYVTRDMRTAELDWQLENTLAQKKDTMPADQFAQMAPITRATSHWFPPAWLAFRTLASGLILVALTRQRSRAFFEAAAATVSDRAG